MDNSLQNELRQKMRELRDLGGYSQKDMADAMEITLSSSPSAQPFKIRAFLQNSLTFIKKWDYAKKHLFRITTDG
ncbi:MAG: hypothetical protein ACKVT2_21745, partial [Saprospiraceae bacterium]